MCKTEDVAKMAEKEGLLPPNHFGGRPGKGTTDSIHIVVKTIKDAWRKGLVASVLFLDIKGAFPSVAMNTLIHELRMRGVPKEHVEWVKRRNEGRKTRIIFDDYESELFNVEDGLDQGDAQSLILYILYNANILIIPILRNGEWTFIFVDDVALITTGRDFTETHRKLKEMMEREGGVLEWARTHNCSFGIEKFQLLDAGRKTMSNPLGTGKRVPIPRPTLVVAGQRIKPVSHVKFLGIHIDQGLWWKEQGAAAVGKGAAWLIQFGRLAKPSKGISYQHIRKLFISVAIPRILYGADIFLTPPNNCGGKGKVGGATRTRLSALQGRVANMIAGGMHSSPHDTAETHANLLPFHLLVDKIRYAAAIRLATLPATHPLYKPVRDAAANLVKTHPTPLHDLMHRYNITPKKMETIDAVRKGPKWKSKAKIKIHRSKEEAVEDERMREGDRI